jgi:hypothetical protein
MAVETTGNKKKQQAAQNDNNDRAAINNEDPQQHRQRFSLLDSIRDTLDRQGRKQIIHRIVVCGEFQSDKLTTGNRQEIGSKHLTRLVEPLPFTLQLIICSLLSKVL